MLGGPVDVEAGSDVGGGGTVAGLDCGGVCINGSQSCAVSFPRRSLHRARRPRRTFSMLRVLSRPFLDWMATHSGIPHCKKCHYVKILKI